MVGLLRRTHDSQRLVQKFSLGRGDADDLLALLRTIEATTELAASLEHRQVAESEHHNGIMPGRRFHALRLLVGRLSLDKPTALATSIAAAIDEEGLSQSHRVEEVESADIVTLAQNVLQNEGSAEDIDALSGVVRSKVNQKAPSDGDSEDIDTWIMRKT